MNITETAAELWADHANRQHAQYAEKTFSYRAHNANAVTVVIKTEDYYAQLESYSGEKYDSNPGSVDRQETAMYFVDKLTDAGLFLAGIEWE